MQFDTQTERRPFHLIERPSHSSFLQMSDKETLRYLKQSLPQFPAELWSQLKHLDTNAVDVHRSKQREAHTHTGYELEMVRLVLEFGEQLEHYFFAEDASEISFGVLTISRDDFIPSLCSMILMSDIGKAGSHLLKPGEVSPVLSMYTNVIMDQRHSAWIRATPLFAYPDDLQPIVQSLSQNPKVAEQIFHLGNFSLLPIRVALYCAAQVHQQEHPTKKTALFDVDQELLEALAEMNMDSDHTTMREFWTMAHLICGEQLFQTVMRDETTRQLAFLSLFHHFSQPGALPSMADHVSLDDPRALEVIAFMEIMDKLNANCHRSHIGAASVVSLTENTVMPMLHTPNIRRAYEHVFDLVKTLDLSAAFFTCAPHPRE